MEVSSRRQRRKARTPKMMGKIIYSLESSGCRRRGLGGRRRVEFCFRWEMIKRALDFHSAKMLVGKVHHRGPILLRECVSMMRVIYTEPVFRAEKFIGPPCDIPGDSVKAMRKSILVVCAVFGTALNALSQAAPPATPQQTPPIAGQPAPAGRGGLNMAGPPRPAPQPPYTCDPVNPNATPEARALLKTLCAVSGKGILSGQHNFPNHRAQDTDRGSPAAGSIIYLCWHMLRPTEDEPGKAGENGRPSESWRGSVQARLTDEQWLELITSDTPLHQRWEKYMDTAAGFLQQLQDAHIPVLWRPMHENNGTFFWW